MRTALLISGLPRAIDSAFPNIRSSLIAPNNPDVFIHTWGSPDDSALRDKITNLYHPISMTIEPSKSFANTHVNLDRMMASYGRSYSRPGFVDMVYSMWYSMLQSNLLKEVYRLQNDIHYDFVIRARFDINYRIPVVVSEYSGDVIYIANRPDLPPEMINDMFAFGSNELMNLYCGGFTWIEHLLSKRNKLDGIFCGETILYEMFGILNIKHQIVEKLDAWKCR